MRALEHALAHGDETVRAALGNEYLRLERWVEALRTLAAVEDAPLDVRGLEQRAWREALARLGPAAVAPRGPSFPSIPTARESELVGWLGAGRHAVLKVGIEETEFLLNARLAVLDREAWSFVVRPEDPVDPELFQTAAATERGVFCRPLRGGGTFFVSEQAGWARERLDLPGWLLDAHPAGTHVVVFVQEDGTHRVIRLSDRRTLRRGPGFPAISWDHDRLVWREGAELRHSSLTGEEPAQALSAEVPASWERPAFLEDGRLVAERPPVLIDLDGDESVALAAPLSSRLGDFTLSWDGRSLLALSAATPIRLPLAPAANRRRARRRLCGPWHPRADLAVVRTGRRALVLTSEGDQVLSFGPDVRPLGWTPDGLGLLVARPALELWTPGGAA